MDHKSQSDYGRIPTSTHCEIGCRTIRYIISRVFHLAITLPKPAEVYASYLQWLVYQGATEAKDEHLYDTNGFHLSGSALLKRYILHHTQEVVHGLWIMEENQFDLEPHVLRERLKFVKLVTELFNQDLLTESVIINFIQKLLLIYHPGKADVRM